MRVTIAQINTTVGDFEANYQKITRAIEIAENDSSDLVVFPELTLTGYPPKDLLLQNEFIEKQNAYLDKIVEKSDKVAVVIGAVETNKSEGKPFYNSAFVIKNKKIIHIHRKFLLPFYDVFDEGRYFEQNKESKHFEIFPGGGKIYLTICEDIWNDKNFWEKRKYVIDPLDELINKKKEGDELIINISASPFCVGKEKVRINMLRAISRKYKRPILYVNLVGGNDELVFDGGSLVLNEHGEVVENLKYFEEDIRTIDLKKMNKKKNKEEEAEDIEMIYKALITGVRDYTLKCGFKKVVVGLSGGIDSSVVAVIARNALGSENVLGVLMPSRFTSESSIDDAKKVAENISINLLTIPIEEIFCAYLRALGEIFKGKNWDITEENLQARIRGTILMALSNKFGSLVLSTGNKSELAMGYCTLYGDMCGGLCVIGDIFKMDVYRLGQYINGIMNKEVIPESVFKKAPTAELRANQTDQDTLPPYLILDDVLRLYIEEEISSEEIVKAGFEKELVKKILRTVDRNEFKRRQSAPCIKISPRAFGFGRRMPIAQRYRD